MTDTSALDFIFTPEAYGARGDDPDFDDAPGIQAALEAAEAVGGELRLGPKTYHLRSGIRQSRAATVRGFGYGDTIPTNSGPQKSVTTLKMMAPVKVAWLIQSQTYGERIYNPRLYDFCIHGHSMTDIGIWARSTNLHDWDGLYVRQCLTDHAICDDGNGELSARNRIGSFVCDVSRQPKLQKANGLVLDSVGMVASDAKRIGLTQYHLGYIYCTSGSEGEGLIIGDIDSTLVEFYQGKRLYLAGVREDRGLRAARKITLNHVASDIHAESGVIAKIFNVNSEPCHKITEEPGAALHYAISGRLSGSVYQSQSFTLGRSLNLSAKDANTSFPAAGELTSVGAQHAQALKLSGKQTTANWTVLPPDDFDDGAIQGLCLRYCADPGADVEISVELRSAAVGQGFGKAQTVMSAHLPAGAKSGRIYLCETLEMDHRFGRGDILTINIQRLTGENSQALNIFGVECLFKADGPIENRPEVRTYNAPSMVAERYKKPGLV